MIDLPADLYDYLDSEYIDLSGYVRTLRKFDTVTLRSDTIEDVRRHFVTLSNINLNSNLLRGDRPMLRGYPVDVARR